MTHRVHHRAHPPVAAHKPVRVPRQTAGAVAAGATAAAAATAATASSSGTVPTAGTQTGTSGTTDASAAAQQTGGTAADASGSSSTATPTATGTTGATNAAGNSAATTAGAASTASGATGTSGSTTAQQGIDAVQGMAALKQQFGADYEDPIVAADGTVYMEQKKPDLVGGKLVLRYIRVATISADGKTMYPDQAFLAAQEALPDPSAKPVEINNQYYWQTMADDGTGTGGLTAKLTPITPAQLQKLQADATTSDAQTKLQTYNTNTVDWMQKLEGVSGWMKTIGFTGSFLQGMAAGPNPATGAPSAHWLTGYMILQMLNGQAGGKLLPQALQTGVLGTALNYALQGMFFLQTPHDLHVLGQAFPRAASVMNTFTAPTRAILNGVKSIGSKVDSAIPGSAPEVASAAADAANGAESASHAAVTAAASTESAAAATGGMSANIAAHIGSSGPSMGVGREIFDKIGGAGAGAGAGAAAAGGFESDVESIAERLKNGAIHSVVGASNGFENAIAVVDGKGAVSLVDKTALQSAMKSITPAAAGADRIQHGIDQAMGGALKSLTPALGPLKVMGGLFGAAAGALNVGLEVKNYGVKALFTQKDGRSALFGMLGGIAFLGLMALPSVRLGAEIMPVVASAMNVATNIFYGVSMLNGDGLFGGGGWLDHDAVRAAFLIPPLTPLGLAGLLMKRNENRATAAAAALKKQQDAAVQTVQTVRSDDQSQLQQSGSIASGQVQSDGSISVATSVSNDLTGGTAGNTGLGISSALGHLMSTIGRPVEYITH